jgi:arsenate reductase (glutaredoxin)
MNEWTDWILPMQTSCSRCQALLNCGASEKSCWCAALPRLPAAQLRASKACLCAPCLQAERDAGVVLYGIANCDTVKKARAWLAERGVAHTFWDYKHHGVPAETLPHWLARLGWECVVNRRGTAWRGLPDAAKLAVVDAASAQALLLASPSHASVIKRPIVAWGNTYGGAVTLGFDAALWAEQIKIRG